MNKHKHKFWDAQPVRIYSKHSDKNKELCDNKTHIVDEDIQDDKLIKAINEWRPDKEVKLPNGFSWKIMNLSNSEQLDQVYKFLNKNYITKDGLYKVDIKKEYLDHFLNRTNKSINIGLINNSKLYGFVTGIIKEFYIYKKVIKVAIVSMLSVHRKLRGKYIAASLIRKVTHEVAKTDTWQAIYFVEKNLKIHKPLTTLTIYHRLLNYRLMCNLGFTHESLTNYNDRMLKYHKIKYELIELNTLDDDAIEKVRIFYNQETKKKADAFLYYSSDLFKKEFISNNDVINSFVVYENQEIMAFVSFVTMHYIFKKDGEDFPTKIARLYLYACNNDDELYKIIKEVLYYCKQNRYVLFNSTNSFKSDDFLETTKFIRGTGKYNFYIYNWDCKELSKNRLLFDSI